MALELVADLTHTIQKLPSGAPLSCYDLRSGSGCERSPTLCLWKSFPSSRAASFFWFRPTSPFFLGWKVVLGFCLCLQIVFSNCAAQLQYNTTLVWNLRSPLININRCPCAPKSKGKQADFMTKMISNFQAAADWALIKLRTTLGMFGEFWAYIAIFLACMGGMQSLYNHKIHKT